MLGAGRDVRRYTCARRWIYTCVYIAATRKWDRGRDERQREKEKDKEREKEEERERKIEKGREARERKIECATERVKHAGVIGKRAGRGAKRR